MTQHTAFSYLAKRFGLKQLGIAGFPGKTKPPRVAEIQLVKDYKMKTIFVEARVVKKWRIVS